MKKNHVMSAALALLLAVPAAEASNLDTYINILESGKYTIRYVDLTSEMRETHKERIQITDDGTMERALLNEEWKNKPLTGVVVSNGRNRYEEIGYGNDGLCRIHSGNDVLTMDKSDLYSADSSNRLTSFLAMGLELYSAIRGIGQGQNITHQSANTTNRILYGEKFASADMSRLLNAILPDENKSEEMPSYRYVTEGWLSNGMNYVDYQNVTDADHFEIVRYYFSDYTLVKIASAQCSRDKSGRIDVRRNIMLINEFSPTPDPAYAKWIGSAE